MNKKTIKFKFSNGRGQALSGLLDLPAADPLFYGVFAPCFTCTKESHAAHKICRSFTENGAAMLRFDPTGIGQSGGDFADTNFSTYMLDIIAACHAVAAEYQAPKFLMGHSMGGITALAAVLRLPHIRAAATLGSPRDPRYIIDKFRRNELIKIDGDMAEMMVVGKKVTVRKSFVDDMLSHDLASDTAAYDRKLFVFHAPHDDIVHFENAQEIYNRATCDKELVALEESSTHLLEQGAADAAFIAETVTGWFRMHVS